MTVEATRELESAGFPDLPSLVRAAQAGDAEARDALIVRFQSLAVGYAFSVLGDFHTAEDVAQEAFVEALAVLDDLRAPEAFPAWLKRIVFKHCDRMTRGERVRITWGAAQEVPDPAPGPEEGLDALVRRRAVLGAIGRLEPMERAVLALFYIEDRSHAEVAAFLEVPVSTVKSRLHKARKRLARRLLGLVGEAMKENAPDASFGERVAEAVEVFSTKGPERDATNSDWSDEQHAKLAELLDGGETGWQVAVGLSRSKSARVRSRAALHFGLSGDPRGRTLLEQLMSDESAAVRTLALRAYALLIHPDLDRSDVWGIGRPASALPQRVTCLEPLTRMLADPQTKARWYAVIALGAYAERGSGIVDEALLSALGDPVHKVHHAAALVLGAICPSCSRTAS